MLKIVCNGCNKEEPSHFFKDGLCIHCASKQAPNRKEPDARVYEEEEPECVACTG